MSLWPHGSAAPSVHSVQSCRWTRGRRRASIFFAPPTTYTLISSSRMCKPPDQPDPTTKDAAQLTQFPSRPLRIGHNMLHKRCRQRTKLTQHRLSRPPGKMSFSRRRRHRQIIWALGYLLARCLGTINTVMTKAHTRPCCRLQGILGVRHQFATDWNRDLR